MTVNLDVPPLACDSHLHVYDSRFAHVGSPASVVPHATAQDYARTCQARIGTERAVIVTPRIYDVDNQVTLDAIAQLGIERTRGVAVLRPDVSDAELARLHEGGVRGIRFTLYTPAQAVVDFDMVEPLSRRVSELGWHVQLHWTADQIVEHQALLQRLPSTLVFDHLARLPVQTGIAHPAFEIVRRLLDGGRTWLKLSGPYLDSNAHDYADLLPIAKAWVAAAPERLVWGSDWPHTTESGKPDDLRLFALLSDWAAHDTVRRRILVENPAQLYDF
jgi:D-galactarolactone isomerase